MHQVKKNLTPDVLDQVYGLLEAETPFQWGVHEVQTFLQLQVKTNKFVEKSWTKKVCKVL